MALKIRMPIIPDYVPPPDEPDDEPQANEMVQGVPPVPGVSDVLAYNIANPEMGEGDGPTTIDPERVREQLSNLQKETDPESPYFVSPEAAQSVMDNLRQVFARGHMVTRSFPDTMNFAARGHAFQNWIGRPMVEGGGVPPANGTAGYHATQPNPPFASVRGGPTMAPPNSSTLLRERLADFLEGNGVNPEIADAYRERAALQVIPQWGGGNLSPRGPKPGPKIQLGSLLRMANSHYLTQVAQHEAAHEYDDLRGVNRSPDYQERIRELLAGPERPGFLDLVPPSDPTFFWHTYTAPFDQGMDIEELPPVLRPYYLDTTGRPLLNTNPLYRSRQRAFAFHDRGQHGPIPDEMTSPFLNGQTPISYLLRGG